MQKSLPIFPGLLALLVLVITLIPSMSAFSLWHDEVQVFRAADELHTLADFYHLEGFPARIVHPPFFFALLKGWMALAGQTDVALRTLTVLGGFITTALIYRLTTDFTRMSAAGFIAAGLFGNLGFAIYYIHQTHNYSLLLTGTAMLLLFYQRWLGRPDWRYTLGVFASEVLLLYTHYFSIYLLIALNLYTLLRFGFRRRQWLALQALTAVCYLPWMPVLYQMSMTNVGNADLVGLPTSPSSLAVVWEALLYEGWGYYAVGLLVGALALVTRRDQLQRRTIDALGLLLGVGLGSLVLALVGNTAWQALSARRVIYLLVFLSSVMGCGLAYLPVRWRWTAFAALIAFTPNNNLPQSMPGNWFFREAVAFVAQQARPNDALYINVPGKLDEVPFQHYGALLLPREVPFHIPDDDLQSRTYTYLPRERIWVIWRSDSNEPVGWWTNALRRKKLTEAQRQAIGSWNVSLFTAGDDPSASALAADPLKTLVLPQTFDSRIDLVHYQVDRLEVSPGDSLTVNLDWRARDSLQNEWTVLVHLIADDLTTLYGQGDGPPTYFGEQLPMRDWPVLVIIHDQHSFQIDPATPPGVYNLRVGFYSNELRVRMHAVPGDGTKADDGVIIAKIRVSQ